MTSLLDRERGTYTEIVHVDAYTATSRGELYVEQFLDMAGGTARGTILDAGCGTGKAALALTA